MQHITPDELKRQLANNAITAIDIREKWEYDEQNIGTNNIPLYEIPKRLDELERYKEQQLVVFCRTGKRGIQAQKFLTKQGFSNVLNLEGGIEAYLNHDLIK